MNNLILDVRKKPMIMKAPTLAQLPELPSMDDSLNDEGIVLFIKKYF